MTWPNNIPYDLDKALLEIEGRRAPVANSDRWGVIKEWLEKHDLEVRDRIFTAPEIELKD